MYCSNYGVKPNLKLLSLLHAVVSKLHILHCHHFNAGGQDKKIEFLIVNMKPLPAATKAELGLSRGKIEGWQASYVNVISCLLICGKKKSEV